MAKLIFYDKENDILSLHKTLLSDEKFKGNVDAGQFILDVSTKGRVIGIEVMNAIDFFREFNVGKDILENLSAANFHVNMRPDGIIVGIVFKAKNLKQDIPAKIAVPLPRQ